MRRERQNELDSLTTVFTGLYESLEDLHIEPQGSVVLRVPLNADHQPVFNGRFVSLDNSVDRRSATSVLPDCLVRVVIRRPRRR